MTEIKQPKIRFKGHISGWEQRKLKELSTYIRGSFPQPYTNPDFFDEENGKPFVQVADIGFDLKLNPDTKAHISKLAEPKSRFVEAGKVVVALQGSIEKSIGRTAITQYDAYFDRTILIFQDYKIPMNKQYFAQAIKILFEREKEQAWGATISTITKEHLNNFIIGVPNIEEQQKIGDFFKNLDDTIALHQQKLEVTKQFKQTMLKKMFPKNGETTPEIRFKGFTDDWEKYKINEIFKVTRGQVLATTETNEEQSETMPYPVYSSQTKNNGIMGYYKDYLFDTAITWTTDGANAGTVNYRSGKFYSTNVNGVLLSEKGYVNKAIAEILNREAWKWVSHVGNPKLMNNVMGDIAIYIPPSFEEQNILSDFFLQLDEIITSQKRKLEVTKQFKQTMLRKLFI